MRKSVGKNVKFTRNFKKNYPQCETCLPLTSLCCQKAFRIIQNLHHKFLTPPPPLNNVKKMPGGGTQKRRSVLHYNTLSMSGANTSAAGCHFWKVFQGTLMPVVTLLGLVGNSLSILVLHTPGVDMKVSAAQLFLEKLGIDSSYPISLQLQINSQRCILAGYTSEKIHNLQYYGLNYYYF